MSEVVLRSETTDKSGIDVDFDDSAHPQRSEAPLSTLHFDTEEIVEIIPESTEGFDHARVRKRSTTQLLKPFKMRRRARLLSLNPAPARLHSDQRSKPLIIQ